MGRDANAALTGGRGGGINRRRWGGIGTTEVSVIKVYYLIQQGIILY